MGMEFSYGAFNYPLMERWGPEYVQVMGCEGRAGTKVLACGISNMLLTWGKIQITWH